MTERPAFERCVGEFEQAWMAGQIPSIRTYLENSNPENPQQARALLMELICIDLEFRWKVPSLRPSACRGVEDYLRDFPELGPAGEVLFTLIEEEYRARRQWGDSPDHHSYSRRFQAQVEDIARVLKVVDEQLQLEHSNNACEPTIRRNMDRVATPRESWSKAGFLKYSDYLLHEMVGSGQMGRVYRATHAATAKQVAVKFLRKYFLRDETAVRRFLREAHIISGLEHAGIVRVEGVGTTPGGGYFIVMEYLEGPDLAAVIQDGPVPIADAVRWAIQAAEAIEYSNAAGIIHCDLKPANLVLDSQRNVRITDFGLATTVDENVRAIDRIAGTAPYMAPEQVSGWWGRIGPHTDVYGLGAVLYTLLTGRAPFDGSTVTDVLSRVVSGIQPAAAAAIRPSIGPDLAAVVAKCLAKNLRGRYRSAAELAAALAKS